MRPVSAFAAMVVWSTNVLSTLAGNARAKLYRLAAETGLRASELRSLRVSSFDFDSGNVIVDAAYTKNRKQAIIPLRKQTAAIMESYVSGKLPQTEVFNMPHPCSVSRMFRADLKAIDIGTEDDGSGKLDFHSLRHTFGSMLAASGVHPKTAQALMRHSDINLTMSRYTHVFRGQENLAIEALPDFSEPSLEAQKAKATGTDHKTAESAYKPAYKKLANTAYSGFNLSATIGTNRIKAGGIEKGHISRETGVIGHKKSQLTTNGTGKNEWAGADLNRRHTDFQSVALPAELPARNIHLPPSAMWKPHKLLSCR